MGKLTVGVIGCGRIGRIHIGNLLRMSQVELAAVSDIQANDDELRSWAARTGIAPPMTDYRELLGDERIDAVLVCASTGTHATIITEAAQAGKHIFCEKPLSFGLTETKQAIAAAARAGVQLQVGFNRRFDRNFSRIKEIVAGGGIGQPHLARITSRDPQRPPRAYIASSGGMFMDMSIHDFDMARFLLGSEAVEVYAKGAALVDPVFSELGDIDTAVVTLTFASGALAVIDNSRQAVYGYDQRAEVFGSAGSAAADNESASRVQTMTADGVHREKPLWFFLERYREAFAAEIEQFATAVREGAPVPVSGFDGLQAERIAHAALQSLRTGVPVNLREAGIPR